MCLGVWVFVQGGESHISQGITERYAKDVNRCRKTTQANAIQHDPFCYIDIEVVQCDA